MIALKRLYSERNFRRRVAKDPGDHGFIGSHLIERGVALCSDRLTGELIDVGCATKPYAGYFGHVTRYVGCDFDGQRGPVDFECPADAIPVAGQSFDSVLCTEVLEHVPDPAAVWREFHRILRPAGKVLLTTPMYWPSHEVPYDFFRYPAHGLVSLAERSGFRVAELLPRGGVWAFLGQVVLHAIPQYFPFPIQRRIWNRLLLTIDRRRLNTNLSLGWTILALKSET
jgi:SAM-dependent methyltransferase